MAHLFVVEHDRGVLADSALEGLTAARSLASSAEESLHAAIIGTAGHGLASELGVYGVDVIHLVAHEILTDYAPAAWAESLVQLIGVCGAGAVSTTGTERGNEVMAHVGALLDTAMVANCLSIEFGEESWLINRVRWGGSLHERTSLIGPVKLVTFNPHSTEATPASAPGAAQADAFEPELAPNLASTRIVDRVATEEGITLATAPVVISGGRGVGSAEGFGPLEELANLIGGAVGCSRVVTNNGWRNHKFQVGQTGTVIAPELYIACGISGAIQHWVGMMAAKNVLAINTDKDAPMVTKGDYAVIADLHEVVPAIVAEVQRRQG